MSKEILFGQNRLFDKISKEVVKIKTKTSNNFQKKGQTSLDYLTSFDTRSGPTLVGEAGDAGDVPAEHGPALVELVHLEARVPPVHLPAAQRGVGGRRPRPLLLVEVSAAFMDDMSVERLSSTSNCAYL